MFNYATKIQGLLAHANDEANSDATRASYRAKAEAMMREYRIAEEEALATDPGSVSPITAKIVLRPGNAGQGDLRYSYITIFDLIIRHVGIRSHEEYMGDGSVVATVVGYEGDVRYAEFLWTAAYLMFSTRIDPTWDASRSDDENIFLLRNAGVERRRIADMAWGNGDDAAARSKVQRVYIREAARRGEEVRAAGLGFDTRTYREAYANTFVTTLSYRLRTARDAADSVGGGLVLHGRSDRVDEAFYGLFPGLRPDTTPVPVTVWVDPRTGCAKCAKAKTGACNDHSYMRPGTWTQADERRAWNREHGASAQAGKASGRQAAEGVQIQRTHTKAGRIDAANTALEG